MQEVDGGDEMLVARGDDDGSVKGEVFTHAVLAALDGVFQFFQRIAYRPDGGLVATLGCQLGGLDLQCAADLEDLAD